MRFIELRKYENQSGVGAEEITGWHTSPAKAKARTIPGRPKSQAMPNLDLYSDNNDISFHDSCLPDGLHLFRHRRGRKTETSSDASQEMKSLATLPMAAGAAVAGRPPYRRRRFHRNRPTWGRACRDPPAREIYCRSDLGLAPFSHWRE